MTDIEQVIQEMLKPHGFIKNTYVNNYNGVYTGSCHSSFVSFSNGFNSNGLDDSDKFVEITETKVKLLYWNREQADWEITSTDLCDPNSLQTIEDWAKP